MGGLPGWSRVETQRPLAQRQSVGFITDALDFAGELFRVVSSQDHHLSFPFKSTGFKSCWLVLDGGHGSSLSFLNSQGPQW